MSIGPDAVQIADTARIEAAEARAALVVARRRIEALERANDALEDIVHDERVAADAARGQANRAEALLRRMHQTLAAAQRALADLPLDGSDD